MNINIAKRGLPGIKNQISQYPIWTIGLAMLLIYLSPFVTNLLVYPAFLLCIYRIIVYDSRVFATDYCLLMPVSTLFCTSGGMSLYVYICLFAGIWYLIREDIVFGASHALLLILLNYLILRMDWNIGDFLLCFGQLFLLCIILPRQDETSAERTAKLFCIGMLVSSVYALVFRNTWQLQSLLGREIDAYWQSSVTRFRGIFEDPNYYMTLLITALALLTKLRDCRRIGMLSFFVMVVCLAIFGFLTYSKTFLIALLVLIVIGLIWLFRNKHYAWGTITTMVTVVGAWILFSVSTVLNNLLIRFSSAADVSELTTGRSEVYGEYLKAITDNALSLLFGKGLASENLGMDPHNLFLEIGYYLGLVGLALIIAYFVFLIRSVKKKNMEKQNFVARYVVLLMAVLLFNTLHGMFSVCSYCVFLLAIMSMLLTKKEREEGIS